MAINYKVQATIVDIRRDTPQPGDALLLDSNVLYWFAYPRARVSLVPPKPYQTTHYPDYVTKAVAAGANLYWCGLSLSEVANLIEQNERQAFDPSGRILNKMYRHNYPAQRRKVVKQIRYVWNSVKSIASPAAILIDGAATDNALTRLAAQQVDTYDLFLIEAAARNQINQIMTDDGDFVTVPGLQVFTANQNVIEAARVQGKLLNR